MKRLELFMRGLNDLADQIFLELKTVRGDIEQRPEAIATLSPALAARIAALNDKSIPLTGAIDRRFTKRLKR